LHAFLNELADVLELGMIRASYPLKNNCFCGRNDRAGAFQSTNCCLMVDGIATAHRVDWNVDLEAALQQVERCLLHAYVSLDSRKHDLGARPLPKRLDNPGNGAATKRDFIGTLGYSLGQFGDCGTESFGILLRRLHGYFEQLGRVDEEGRVPDQ